MRGIVVDPAALVALQPFQEHLEGDAIHHILARMKLEADIDAVLVEGVKQRLPAAGQFVKSLLDQTGRTGRPAIKERPAQGPGKGYMGGKPQVPRCLCGVSHLLFCPCATLPGLAMELLRRKGIEGLVIGGMDRHKLTLEMSRKFGDLDAVLPGDADQLIAIGFRFGRLLQVDHAGVPARNLHAAIAQRRRPGGDVVPIVKRCRVARELGQKDRGPLQILRHSCPP